MGSGADPLGAVFALIDRYGMLLLVGACVVVGGVLVFVGPALWRFVAGTPEAGAAGLLGTAATVAEVRRRSRKRRKVHAEESMAEAARIAEASERGAERVAGASEPANLETEPPKDDEAARRRRLAALGTWDD